MKFDLLFDGKVIDSVNADDADHVSEMVSSMYPENWTQIKIVSHNHRAYHFLKAIGHNHANGEYDNTLDYASEARLDGFR